MERYALSYKIAIFLKLIYKFYLTSCDRSASSFPCIPFITLSDLDILHDPEHSAWYKPEAKSGLNGGDYLDMAGSDGCLGGQGELWVFSKQPPWMGRSSTWAGRLAPAFPQMLQVSVGVWVKPFCSSCPVPSHIPAGWRGTVPRARLCSPSVLSHQSAQHFQVVAVGRCWVR